MDMSDLTENPKEPDKAAGYAARIQEIAWSSTFYEDFSPAQQVTGSIWFVTRWQQSTYE
jgi:hypothetical protein